MCLRSKLVGLELQGTRLQGKGNKKEINKKERKKRKASDALILGKYDGPSKTMIFGMAISCNICGLQGHNKLTSLKRRMRQKK